MFDFSNGGDRDRAPQALFNEAYIGVMMQGKPSRDLDTCKYLTNDGLRCGIGWLIDDATATEWDSLENSHILTIVESLSAPDWIKSNAELLADIQDAHDKIRKYSGPENFRELFYDRMAFVAERHGLTVPSLAFVTASDT
jgi:hypothetical protein